MPSLGAPNQCSGAAEKSGPSPPREPLLVHIFLCMLAYYVERHMREAWAELLFADEDQAAKATRDPVAPAQRSEAGQTKAQTRRLADGTPAHSFRTLLEQLATIVRNTYRVPRRRKDAADVRDGDNAERSPATRPRADRPDRPVDRKPAAKIALCPYRPRRILLSERGNFRLVSESVTRLGMLSRISSCDG
jgi:hypothetical protein